MATTLTDLIQSMLLNAPDPKEPLPLANKKATIYGATLPFLILCWFAVALRMWVRLRVMREPGWDDVCVVIAVLLNTAATVFVLISVDYGLGHHCLYIGIPKMQGYIEMFYFENALYITNTAVIKLSLLLQYLRIFKAGTMRWVCVSLFVLISLWGLTYSFMAWFPCFPPQAYWDRQKYPNVKCYGFGFSNPKEFSTLFESHTALNMVFDITIFITPMVLFKKPNLRMKNLAAMTGIFFIGAVVVTTSIWRLYTIVEHRAATQPYIDFTWWSPCSIILSALEIDLAIMCASMPIFWPVIEQSFAAIFITQEVQVTAQTRHSFVGPGLSYELEHGRRVRRQLSMKSDNSATSRESLVITREITGGLKDPEAVEMHYRDPYLAAHVDPFKDGGDARLGTHTNVDSKPKEKWRI